jgi:hypothetical protein
MSESTTKTSLTSALYRHGDVLVSLVPYLPSDAVKRPHLVLAEGEVTGHAHRVADRSTAELWESGADRYLHVVADHARLVHEEHGPIDLPKGVYRVWRQREYSPQEIRVVRD